MRNPRHHLEQLVGAEPFTDSLSREKEFALLADSNRRMVFHVDRNNIFSPFPIASEKGTAVQISHNS
jgi:hypothetical protein